MPFIWLQEISKKRHESALAEFQINSLAAAVLAESRHWQQVSVGKLSYKTQRLYTERANPITQGQGMCWQKTPEAMDWSQKRGTGLWAESQEWGRRGGQSGTWTGGLWSREKAEPGQCHESEIWAKPGRSAQLREALRKGPRPGDLGAGARNKHCAQGEAKKALAWAKELPYVSCLTRSPSPKQLIREPWAK